MSSASSASSSGTSRVARRCVVGLGCLALLACQRSATEPGAQDEAPRVAADHDEGRPVLDPSAVATTAPGPYLEGAALEGRYSTTALAELARSLPRPSPSPSPLVSVFGGLVDAFLGDPRERLEAVGLRADAEIHVSARALDGRGPAVRKLLGELQRDAIPAPQLVAQLASEARTLGVHVRASLPTRDTTRLIRALTVLVAGLGDEAAPQEPWAAACAALDASFCVGRPRLLVWARPGSGDHVQVDAVYLFYEGADAADLDRALARADGWSGQDHAASLSEPGLDAPAPFELRLHARPTADLLEAEALADAVEAFVDPEQTLDYPSFLDRERALHELAPADARLRGLALSLSTPNPPDPDLHVHMRWLAREPRPGEVTMAELFAPVVERGTLPVIHGDCATAEACVRVGGLASVLRFLPLATGPFADTTGASRVLRQAGDRGLILLGLSSWPNLLGTFATMAEPSRGLMSSTEVALLRDSYGFGLFILELGAESPAAPSSPAELGADEPDPDELDFDLGERWVAYLRVGSEALAAIRPALNLLGAGPRPIDLEGVDGVVERGAVQDQWVYLVDESERRGGFGGWLLGADADARVPWLLETPRDPSEPAPVDPLIYVHINAFGALAAQQQVAYTDDPPVRRWLDDRTFELRGRLDGAAFHLDLTLTMSRD